MAVITTITGSFAATGVSAAATPYVRATNGNAGMFNVWLDFDTGPGVGTVNLQKSPDNGTTWYDVKVLETTLHRYESSANEVIQEPDQGVLYRLKCTNYTSGTIYYRIG